MERATQQKEFSRAVSEEHTAEREALRHTAVSVIVPAYNEEAAIGPQIQRIEQVMESAGWAHELIVVDDGSTDQTAEMVRHSGVRLVQLPRNSGYGAALKAGIAAAQHEWILIMDADGTYPPEAVPAMLARVPEHDMVVAARTGQQAYIPLSRRPAKWILTQLASYLAEQHIPDLNSGLRVFRKSLVERFAHLLPSGFSFTTTITLALMCNGYRIFYHPINYSKRVGRSKIRPVDAYHFLLLILRTVVFFNPLRVFLPLGALFFLAGLAKFIYDVFLWNLSESAVMFILTAVLLWSVGLLADQISRIALALKSK